METPKQSTSDRHRHRPKKPLLHFLGAGIISAASDNDPTTVATLAVIGATTVYGLGWLVMLVIPMLAVVQVIGAHVGGITKHGLETDSRKLHGGGIAFVMFVSVVSVTFVTLIADLEGAGAALQVLSGIDYRWWLIPVAVLSLAVLIFGSYERVKHVLLIFPFAFLGYPISAVLAHPDWHAVLAQTFIPHLERTQDYAAGVIALLGTTLTSYSYVWQEIEIAKERPPIKRLGWVEADATFGTIFSGLSFWAIVIATGATLGIHHQTVDTADQAAKALEPLAGRYAQVLFGVGLLGSALIAVPVLIGTSACMLNEALGWHSSLDTRWKRGKPFYGSMIAMTLTAALAGLLGAPPIKVLFIASIIGGVGTPLSLGIMLLVARSKTVMGHHPIGAPLAAAGWCVAGIVVVATVVYFISLITN